MRGLASSGNGERRESIMSRQVVLCFDGTNNKYADRDDTNVIKLYQMLDQSSTQCLRYYQPGIGTMAPIGMWGKTKKWLIEKLDLAIAWLLEEHVCDGYRYLMHTCSSRSHAIARSNFSMS